jgi:hypothetical protein
MGTIPQPAALYVPFFLCPFLPHHRTTRLPRSRVGLERIACSRAGFPSKQPSRDWRSPTVMLAFRWAPTGAQVAATKARQRPAATRAYVSISVHWFEVATQRRLSAKVMAATWKGRCPWLSEFAICNLQSSDCKKTQPWNRHCVLLTANS